MLVVAVEERRARASGIGNDALDVRVYAVGADRNDSGAGDFLVSNHAMVRDRDVPRAGLAVVGANLVPLTEDARCRVWHAETF